MRSSGYEIHVFNCPQLHAHIKIRDLSTNLSADGVMLAGLTLPLGFAPGPLAAHTPGHLVPSVTARTAYLRYSILVEGYRRVSTE